MHIFGGGLFARRTNPSEVRVLVWCAIIGSVLLGMYCLWVGFRAPPDKAEYASMVKLYGLAFLLAGPVLWVGYRVVGNLLDR